MAFNLSKPFLNYFILYSELPDEIARLDVHSPILQKKLKQKNVRQLFKVSRSVHDGSYSNPTVLGDTDNAGFFIISSLHTVEIWWGH